MFKSKANTRLKPPNCELHILLQLTYYSLQPIIICAIIAKQLVEDVEVC